MIYGNSDIYFGREMEGDVTRASGVRRHLPLGELEALRYRAYANRQQNNLLSIIDWLDVENSLRYRPNNDSTFCNIYAFDYCYLNNVYLPRILRSADDHSLDQSQSSCIAEMSSNRTYDWLISDGAAHGWRPVDNLSTLQQLANNNHCCLIVAHGRSRLDKGHVSLVVPEDASCFALRKRNILRIPVQSFAGKSPTRLSSKSLWWTSLRFGNVRYWACPLPETSIISNIYSRSPWFSQVISFVLRDLIDEIRVRMAIASLDERGRNTIPEALILALVAAEDRRFFAHHGFDLRGILRAMLVYARRQPIQGASTVEQQLIRTLTNRRSITIERKFTEIAGAVWVCTHFSKRSIATIYLDRAYYGWRMNGLQQLAVRLGIDISKMSEQDIFDVVSYLRYPLPREPSPNYLAKQRKRSSYIRRICTLRDWVSR